MRNILKQEFNTDSHLEEKQLHPKGKPYGCKVCFEWYDGIKCTNCQE